ncbi:MAG: hypothetical protein HC839_03195 [Leptolyngbyaceae cyanobacterium RM2_2_21]|nr:hypothetical protein [Leptolyngbyaceae cyanobacterium RM2_2_21]
MSEANVPSRDSESPSRDRATDMNSAEVSLPNVPPADPPEEWQTVDFPGAVSAAAIAASQPQPAAAESHAEREAELLTLVRDLNQCNNHLIARVARLEEALEASQTALQIEVARSQEQQSALSRNERIAVNNQQIAQIVSDLDFANQSLRRQQMLNETLQTEVENSRQRVTQLERECAIVQQRYREQSQALHQAETACRDLRARLQRQQRYTVQFKVALEKCLDVPPGRQTPAASEPTTGRLSTPNGPVVMPKAQRIQPWSSTATPTDYTLAALIAGSVQPTPAPIEPPLPEAASSSLSGPDPEAENLLWQDLERVIKGSAQTEVDVPAETGSSEAATAAPKMPPETPQFAEVEFTEPSPWGMPIKLEKPLGPSSPAAPPASSSASVPADSPGETLETADPAPAAAVSPVPIVPAVPVAAKTLLSEADLILPPALTASATASPPSPTVYPLRPPKKRQSLAAVELPSFPKSKPPIS